MKFPTLIALLACFPVASAEAARERAFIDEPEPPTPRSVEDGELWQERKAALPPWPQDGDLVEFQVDDRARSFRYFIDGRHLEVGSDGVVRYTLVVEAGSGVRNLSVEGIRCTPQGDHKVYAYGAGGSFKPVSGEEWQPIRGRAGNQVQRDLHGHFLCVPLKFQPRPKKDMIRALRGPINPRQNTGFLPD